MLHSAAKKLGEHDAHDQKLQKRREHAPRHAEDGTLVFLLKIALDQLLKEETILLQSIERIFHSLLN